MSNQLTPQVKPFWGLISVALPIVAVIVAFRVVAGASRGIGGDMVGPMFFLYAAVGLGVIGIFGTAAAIRATAREEKWGGISVVGLLLNLALIAGGCFYGSVFL